MRCLVPVVMTRTISRLPKSVSPTIAKNAWPATERTLRRNTMPISPTARYAICRRLRAPMSPTHRSRTTGFPAVLPSRRGSRKKSALRPPLPRLLPFPDSLRAEQDTRDLALAWQSLANDGMEGAESHAESLLRAAVAEFPEDPDILSALAYVEQKHGLTAQASELYRRALAANPDLIDAAANLGVIEAETGHLREAVELWQGAFQRAPGRSSLGMNLVAAFCEARQFDEARDATLRVLEFNPDMAAAKKALQNLNRTPPDCGN